MKELVKLWELEFLDLTNWSIHFFQRLIFLIAIVLMVNQGFSQDNSTKFQDANNLYQSKKYAKAIDLYEDILAEKEESEELYFNLGNAYFRNGNLAKAILNFERALLINPNSEDVVYNLKIANESRVDELDELQPFFLKQWWENLRQTASEGVWSSLGILFLWLGVAGIVIYLFGEDRVQKKKGFITGLVLLFLSIIPFSLASSLTKFENNSKLAILMEKSIFLKSGPDPASTDIIKIHEGLKLELLDNIGEWYKVKLSNGEQGWLPEGVFEEI